MYRFFGGKGGVGKTTCAAAAATGFARRGARVLAISTDPAHSLGDVLGKRLGAKPSRVPGVRGHLHAMELAADRALDLWLDERRELLARIADRGTWLDRSDVERFLALSFPGVDELVALIEIARVVDSGTWDEVIVDTAPTGHTLRMLAMPSTLARVAGVLDEMQGKHRVIAETLGRTAVEDEADELIAEIRRDAEHLTRTLRDPASASFHWVTAAEPLAIAEAAAGASALARDGFSVVELLVNRLTPASRGACAMCSARRAEEQRHLRSLPDALRALPRREIDESDRMPLAAVERALFSRRKPASPVRPPVRPERGRRPSRRDSAPASQDATASLPLDPRVRLVLLGGKGGVGKSTAAAAIALETAARAPGTRMLLLSIDPAHSLGDALGQPLSAEARAVDGGPPNLRVRELDAPAAFARVRDRYRGSVDEIFDRMRGESRFDAAYDRAIVRDLLDLAPPGLDEIFAILAVVEALGLDGTAPEFDRVVLDTAPTGHALRLLEMPERAAAWVKTLLEVLLKYRGILRGAAIAGELVALSKGLRALRELLADPARTAFVAVARPEPVVVAETRRLLSALRARRIPVRCLLVNASIRPWSAVRPPGGLPPRRSAPPRSSTPPGCARCRTAAKRELAHNRTLAKAARGCAIIQAPLVVPPPRGPEALLAFRAAWRSPLATKRR